MSLAWLLHDNNTNDQDNIIGIGNDNSLQFNK